MTDRGTPVARLLAIDAAPLLDQLTEQGVLARASRPGRPSARDGRRVTASGPVAEIVGNQRR